MGWHRGVSFCCLATGAILVLVGIVVLAALPSIIHNLVKGQVTLSATDNKLDHTAEIWAHPPFKISMQFYMFNVTNPDEIMTLGQKPAVIQHGPYGYLEKQDKYNYSFDASGEHITYWNNKQYFFSPELSCSECSESDLMTVPNLVLLVHSIGTEPFKSNSSLAYLASLALAAIEPSFVTKNVGDLIFKGYSDLILNVTQAPILAPIIKNMGLDLPHRLGFFYGDGEYYIKTGKNDLAHTGYIQQWNHSSLVPETWWMTNQSRMVNGTDGTIFPPFVSRDDKPPLFVTDICRSVYLTYLKDVEFEGIPAYRFTIPARVFAATVPENKGFCVNTPFTKQQYYASQPPGCLPDGLLDASNCQAGNPPVIVSSPHFLYCPDEVVDSVQGMHPVESEHHTVVDLEPNTGVGVNFARRLQINVAVNNYPHLVQFQNVKNVIIPVLWINESAHLDQGTRDLLYQQIVLGQTAFYGMGFAALGIGALTLIGIGVAYLIVKTEQKRDPNRMMSNPIYSPSAMSSHMPSAGPSVSVTPQIQRRLKRESDETFDSPGTSVHPENGRTSVQ